MGILWSFAISSSKGHVYRCPCALCQVHHFIMLFIEMTFAYIESFVLLGQDVFPHMQPYRLIPDLQPVIQWVHPVYKVQVSCAVSQGIWHKEGVLLELNKQQGNIWGHQEPIPCNFPDSDSQASELEMPKEQETWHSVSKVPPMALSVISCQDSREPLRALCFHTEPEWSCCSRHPHVVLSCRSDRNHQIV